MKRILIVGSASTLGIFLSHELSVQKYELYGTYHKYLPLNPADYKKLYFINLLNPQSLSKLKKIIPKLDHIIFTVGDTNFSHDPRDVYRANFEALKNFVDFLKITNENIPIIFCSSTSVYSAVKGLTIDEKTKRIPSNEYGRSKINAENYLMNSGLKYAILRFPIVYGSSFAFKFSRMFEAAKTGSIKIFGLGRNKIPFVYEKDIIRVILKLFEKVTLKEDFIVSSGTVTQKEYWGYICKLLNIKAPKTISINKAYQIARNQLKMYKKEGIPPRLLKEDIDTFSRNRIYDCSKVKTMLHWSPKNKFSKILWETFVAKERILRENANKLLFYLFKERVLPMQNIHSSKEIDLNYFGKYPRFRVWSVTVKESNQIPSVSTLFSRKLSNIISEIKRHHKRKYFFIIRKSPAKSSILCHGSFLIDRKNYGEKVMITISMQNKQKDKLEKTKKGFKLKILPRDFNTDLSIELEESHIAPQTNTVLFKKIKPSLKILKRDINKLKSHLARCNKQDLLVPGLFIMTNKHKVYYVSMGM